MERELIKELYKWKDKKNRKPLIIRGARQVGKTWLLKEFGKEAFAKTVYLNLENDKRIEELFSGGFDISRIVTGIELYIGNKIDPENTLII